MFSYSPICTMDGTCTCHDTETPTALHTVMGEIRGAGRGADKTRATWGQGARACHWPACIILKAPHEMNGVSRGPRRSHCFCVAGLCCQWHLAVLHVNTPHRCSHCVFVSLFFFFNSCKRNHVFQTNVLFLYRLRAEHCSVSLALDQP